jgi:hypothetical protein
MNVTLHHHHSRAWTIEPVTPPEPVFVAEQRGRGPTPHTGLATLTHWLTPVMGGERLAGLRLPSGACIEAAAHTICPATNVVRLRRPA